MCRFRPPFVEVIRCRKKLPPNLAISCRFARTQGSPHPSGQYSVHGLRYTDPTLTTYVGEEVVLRYDPRDMAEIRLFYRDRFLCRAICQELASETVTLGEIISARNHRRRQSRQTLGERRRLVDSLLEAKRSAPATQQPEPPTPPPVKLKRYFCDE
jgi:putative transposase